MAYILTGHPHAGPFAHKAGEFVGNYRPGEKDGASGCFDPKKHSLGRPRPTQPGETVGALLRKGWKGKYLLEESDPWDQLNASDGTVIILKVSKQRNVWTANQFHTGRSERKSPWASVIGVAKTPSQTTSPSGQTSWLTPKKRGLVTS
jgi:hypothetical protein